METALKLNPHSFTSIPLLNLIPKPNSQKTYGSGFGAPLMRDLAPLRLNRFNLNHYYRHKFIQNLPNSLSQIKPVSLSPPSMAEEATVRRENPPVEEEREKERKPAKELPTPPEKPEPGDCCGSGCVRCVWDVYYDELEDYNQRLKEFNFQTQTETQPPNSQG